MAAAASKQRTLTLVLRRPPDAQTPVELDAVAREAGMHPSLVRRLIQLGAVEPVGGNPSSPLLPRDAAARLARVARLRRDLGLNYAGAVLACELVTRIEA